MLHITVSCLIVIGHYHLQVIRILLTSTLSVTSCVVDGDVIHESYRHDMNTALVITKRVTS